MKRLVVDRSLEFRFAAPWKADIGDGCASQRMRSRAGRKAADIAAAADRALLVEVKDDRAMDAGPRALRRKAVARGSFFEDVADKLRCSVVDLLDSTGESPSWACFSREWLAERRRLVLWWERGRYPPSGPGTPDERWKAYWSAQGNLLKSLLADLTTHVFVAGRPFRTGPDRGISVHDVPAGIARRRRR